MKILDNIVGAIFCALIVIGEPILVWWEFAHPENWQHDLTKNPWVILVTMAFTWCVLFFLLTMMALDARRDRRRTRLAALLVWAEDLVRQHRREEAAAVLKECETLLATINAA